MSYTAKGKAFLFFVVFRPTMEHTQPLIKGLPGPNSQVEKLGREADSSTPSSVPSQEWRCEISTPLYIFILRHLIKHRGTL
jgi:hypothetical protein